jgi:hypothetical protein
MKVTTSTTTAFRTGVLALSKRLSTLAARLESLANKTEGASASDQFNSRTVAAARGTRPAEPGRVPPNRTNA